MTEDLRHACIDSSGAPRTVIEYRHIFTTSTGLRSAHRPGARWLRLADGEPVRYIDPQRFEVIGTGEMIYRA